MTQFGKKRYRTVGLGGTFDHLHKGHQHFLTYASELGYSLLVGVTTEPLTLAKPHQEALQSFHTRASAVKKFCQQLTIPCKIIPLDNPYGPAIEKDTDIRALCVTTETRNGAEDINLIREAASLRPLPVFVSKIILDQSGKNEIHSARIRAGEIDRDGFIYSNLFDQDLTLSEKQKKQLRKPLGQVSAKPNPEDIKVKNNKKIVVGDVSLQLFNKEKIDYNIAIFDGHSLGEEIKHTHKSSNVSTATNPAGLITQSAANTVLDAIKILRSQDQAAHIQVDGEEDLLAAVVIATAPLGSLVYYGQPNQGLVEVVITENVKSKVKHILIPEKKLNRIFPKDSISARLYLCNH